MRRIARLEPRETLAGPVQGTMLRALAQFERSPLTTCSGPYALSATSIAASVSRACHLCTDPPLVDRRIQRQADQMGQNVGARVALSRLAEPNPSRCRCRSRSRKSG